MVSFGTSLDGNKSSSSLPLLTPLSGFQSGTVGAGQPASVSPQSPRAGASNGRAGNEDASNNNNQLPSNWKEEVGKVMARLGGGAVKSMTPGRKKKQQQKSDRRKRCVNIVLGLPWTAIFLVCVALGLVIVFIVFIANSPNNAAQSNQQQQQQVVTVDGSTQVITTTVLTVQCDVSVSDEVCAQRILETAASQSFQQAITEAHLLTTLAMFWFATLVFFVIKAIRRRRRDRYLGNLPRASIAVWTVEAQDTKVLARGRTLPVHEEMERSIDLLKILKTTDPSTHQGNESGDPNWAVISGNMNQMSMEGMHFPTAVLDTYRVLEERAARFDSSLKMSKYESVREYVRESSFYEGGGGKGEGN